ncbi:MAG: hypothetical protein OEL75_02395 [Kiritimatiellaceae bacterium]|nr:hypothetical protein [Kiritimatiellaceae bacterium]
MQFDLTYRDLFFEIRAWGVLDSSTFESFFEALFSHEKWESDCPVLFDYTKLGVGSMSPPEMIDIIHQCEVVRTQIGRGRCAMIVPQKEQYLFARMFMRRSMFMWDVEMEAFDARDAALNWLLEGVGSQNMHRAEATCVEG